MCARVFTVVCSTGRIQQFWRDMFRRFASSGQSVRAFCAARRLSEPFFYSWRRTLARRDQIPAARSSSTPTFVPVHIAAQDGRGTMEIVLCGERRIRLSGAANRTALAQVVAVLELVP